MPSVGILLIFRHYTSAITRNKSPPSFYIYSKWDANDGISEESEWRGTFCNVWTMRENVRSRKKMERNKCCLLILFLCQITGEFYVLFYISYRQYGCRGNVINVMSFWRLLKKNANWKEFNNSAESLATGFVTTNSSSSFSSSPQWNCFWYQSKNKRS